MHYSCTMCCPFSVESTRLRWMFALWSSVRCGSFFRPCIQALQIQSTGFLFCTGSHKHTYSTHLGKYASLLSGSLAFTASCPPWIILFLLFFGMPSIEHKPFQKMLLKMNNSERADFAFFIRTWRNRFFSFLNMLMYRLIWGDYHVIHGRAIHPKWLFVTICSLCLLDKQQTKLEKKQRAACMPTVYGCWLKCSQQAEECFLCRFEVSLLMTNFFRNPKLLVWM